MSARQVRVDLTIDTTAYVEAMNRATHALRRLAAGCSAAARSHRTRHHRRETPARARMHAAYDRRRRARRRRR